MPRSVDSNRDPRTRVEWHHTVEHQREPIAAGAHGLDRLAIDKDFHAVHRKLRTRFGFHRHAAGSRELHRRANRLIVNAEREHWRVGREGPARSQAVDVAGIRKRLGAERIYALDPDRWLPLLVRVDIRSGADGE